MQYGGRADVSQQPTRGFGLVIFDVSGKSQLPLFNRSWRFLLATHKASPRVVSAGILRTCCDWMDAGVTAAVGFIPPPLPRR